MGAFYRSLLQNHVLANLVFVLVLVIGLLSYMNLPRQQDPTINFNWIVITTVLPGASALDVEKKVTDPIEDAVRKIQNINFMSSTSRESVSSILVRFQDIDERTFDKSVADLRREIQNKESELPDAAEDPQILEITTANAFPSATVAVVGQSLDEELRIQARNIQKGLERVKGVDRVDPIGLPEPELQVNFDTALLEELNLSPGQVADTVSAFFQDITAGDTRLGEQNWLVRLVGSSNDPGQLASRTIVGAQGEVTLGTVARVERGRAEPSQLTSFNERPAVLLAVMKQANANTIELVDRIKAYMQGRNIYSDQTGIELILVDDQTVV
ncbi:efflux RND transporter permease subunit, partial [Solemya velum gill symbiont]